jgi:alpha-L-rhamnosidase
MSREGLLFDFGENNAGYCRLKLRGAPGQKIELQFAEFETDGNIDYTNINFFPDGFAQRDVYYCGGGDEVFEPPFTYHGFRYCLVSGLTPEQVTPDVLEYVICTSDIPAAGSFACSDETANMLYAMAERSDRANFYYFPTDCPHREKNGWTGDAALSAEHMLMTMKCAGSYREWMRSVCAAQGPNGFLPCVVPCGEWGENGCGPSWDAVLTELPYQTYRFTGDAAMMRECADAIGKYLGFAASKRDEDGLVEYGLGDWCPVGGKLKVCTRFTNSVALKDMATKAAFIFETLGQTERRAAALRFAEELKAALRKKYIDTKTCVAESGSQSAQATAL